MTDLWPLDLATTAIRSPLTILKEQASLLGLKTKNIVKAGVRRFQVLPPPPVNGGASAKSSPRREEPFQYAFFLEAPALDNYTYGLFSAAYNVSLYPVRVLVDQDIAAELVGGSDEQFAEDEEQFKRLLSTILGSQKTRKVINALLSQSMDLSPLSGAAAE